MHISQCVGRLAPTLCATAVSDVTIDDAFAEWKIKVTDLRYLVAR